MKITKPGLLLASALLLSAMQASAETRSFRCRGDIVKLGEAMSSAMTKCGEPVLKNAFCKTEAPQSVATPSKSAPVVINNNACEKVDEWTYNPGTGQFMTTLRFEQGVVTAITYGQRVK
jgi:hypothetical protein